jgi:8-oxo-dGTP diphosphatase
MSEHALKWEFPGGKLQQKETAEQCIVREIKEELNVEIKIIKRLCPVDYNYGFRHIQLLPFFCTIGSGEIKLTEHKEMRWISLKQFKEIDLLEADRKLIENEKNRQLLEKYLWKNMNDSG